MLISRVGRVTYISITVLLFIGTFLYFVFSSDEFADCYYQRTCYYQAQQLKCEPSSPVRSFRGRINCGWTVVHANADPILAVFTVLLAAFTLCLWISTRNIAIDPRDTAKRQLRAYISADTGEGEIREIDGEGSRSIHHVILKNCGQTPAHQVRYWALIGIQPFPPTGPLDAPESWLGNPAVLHPAQDKTLPADFTFDRESAAALMRENFALYFWGKVYYLDVFGDEQTTEFCFFIDKEALKLGRWAACQYGNTAT